MMKKTAVALTVASCLSAGAVQASDGTINVFGDVISAGCTVSSVSTDLDVYMPDLNTSEDVNAGEAFGEPEVTNIEFSCDSPDLAPSISFTGNPDKANSSLFQIINPDSPESASGVAFRVSVDGNQVVPNGSVPLSGEGLSNHTVKVGFQYVVTGALKKGEAELTTDFTLTYQ